jgi:hypothetical protein
MPIPTPVLIDGGRHHAQSTGLLDVGAGEGQVPALGVGQPMTLALTAFAPLQGPPGQGGYTVLDEFEQIYWVFEALSNGVDRIEQDPVTPYTFNADGVPTLAHFLVDITAPGTVRCHVEPHHSVGR